MTKLAIMSDLHIDSNHFGAFETEALIETLQKEKIEHLHLAGDISNDFYGLSQDFLQTLSQHFELSFNLGNHDMLGLSETEIEKEDFRLHKIGQVNLLSFAGWYDYSFVPELAEERHRKNKQNFWFDRRLNRQKDDMAITRDLLKRLEQTLRDIEGPVIVALHFVPHQDFLFQHPYFRRFNAFMGSPSFHQIFKKHGVEEVVFGHLHHRYRRREIDGVAYQARPLGYIREWQLTDSFFEHYPQYRIPQMYRLHKRYNAVKNLPEFKTYKEKHLAEEFHQAMTIFEL